MLYTIGYATKPIVVFLSQLQNHGVNVVADVRSVPYSKAFDDYRQDNLKTHLSSFGIRYVYLGGELGPRSKDDAHYNEAGQVQFDRLMASDVFLSGIARLENGVKHGYSIALMCAEKDPLHCHRTLLIAHYIRHVSPANVRDLLTPISHITHDGQLESQDESEQRLIDEHTDQNDLFDEAESVYLRAYKQRLLTYAYRRQ
ncbi:MAG: DUF488 domain-containing protein [Pseudomonadota bacterium]